MEAESKFAVPRAMSKNHIEVKNGMEEQYSGDALSELVASYLSTYSAPGV